MSSPSAPAMSSPQEIPPPPRPVVTPEAESRLEQLSARYDDARQRRDAAEAELKEITDGIKAELSTAHPGAPEVLLNSWALAQPLVLQAVASWRLDTKRIKKEHPDVYAAFAKQTTSWRLAPMAG